ncbi:hypothetical protein EDB86DRAFT_887618 [Lactarius hatsudake]|nr:hypothetical protein EDB86DRAFT_887618 [Lactarius hatsudake]
MRTDADLNVLSWHPHPWHRSHTWHYWPHFPLLLVALVVHVKIVSLSLTHHLLLLDYRCGPCFPSRRKLRIIRQGISTVRRRSRDTDDICLVFCNRDALWLGDTESQSLLLAHVENAVFESFSRVPRGYKKRDYWSAMPPSFQPLRSVLR